MNMGNSLAIDPQMLESMNPAGPGLMQAVATAQGLHAGLGTYVVAADALKFGTSIVQGRIGSALHAAIGLADELMDGLGKTFGFGNEADMEEDQDMDFDASMDFAPRPG